LVEVLTDESAADFQVQELENLLGVIRSLDEGTFVDRTHFERLVAISWDRLKIGFDRRTMVRKKGLPVIGGHGVIYRSGRGRASAIHAVP